MRGCGFGAESACRRETVLRKIDLRRIDCENQRLFHRAARLAGERMQSNQPEDNALLDKRVRS
jgi:hypothetical protein